MVALSLAQIGRKGMPDSPNSADTLGWAYYQQGVYNASIDLFQEAIKAQVEGNPENPTYHYHLGMAYQKSNNFDMARKTTRVHAANQSKLQRSRRNQENPRSEWPAKTQRPTACFRSNLLPSIPHATFISWCLARLAGAPKPVSSLFAFLPTNR